MTAAGQLRASATRSAVFAVAGVPLEFECSLPGVRQVVCDRFRPFVGDCEIPSIHGSIEPVASLDLHRFPLDQLDRLDESTWGDRATIIRIDDSVGLIRIDRLRRCWHAYVIDRIDAGSLVDDAVVWPASQLLAGHGRHVIRGVALKVHASGVLVVGLTPGECERWLAVDHRRLAKNQHVTLELDETDIVASPVRDHLSSMRISTVMLIGRDGRPGSVRTLVGNDAVTEIRRHWPIVEAGTSRRESAFISQLAALTRVIRVSVGRDLAVIDRLLGRRPRPTVHTFVNPIFRRVAETVGG